MRWAVLGDIHGNLPALQAVLADARRQGAEAFVITGDLAFKGPFPAEVIGAIQELATPHAIVGNTDQWLFQGFPKVPNPPPAERLAQLRAWRDWALDRLNSVHLAFLRALPFSATLELGRTRVLIVHASPRSTEELFSASASEAELAPLVGAAPPDIDLLVYGHIHVPFVRRVQGKTVVNTGSVGNPVDGDARASYLLLEADGDQIGCTLRRVPYDLETTVRAAQATGFPLAEAYAASLREGRML